MSSKILVAGATGMIGSHITADLLARGDEVVVLSRREPQSYDPASVSGLERIIGDYSDEDFSSSLLEGFDAIAFSAGNDIRHVKPDDEDDAFWDRVQSTGVPRFAAVAKRAGVGRFVQIGSYYHQLQPEWAEDNPYVAARKNADERTRALADESFAAITLNPPSIVGAAGGRPLRHFGRMIAWVRGEVEEPELYAPAGGTNYMSVRSLSQAVLGALDAGDPGHAYLVGDENLTYRGYFQLLADVAGSDRTVEERDQEHPYQPDRSIVQGRGAVIDYEPAPAEVAQLGYDRHDVRRALAEIVERVDARR